MKLSEIIRKYRADNDMSQREFAKRCGLSNSYISFIENECNPKTGRPMAPTIEQYKKIADGMSITVQDLFESLDVDSPVILNNHSASGLNLQRFTEKPLSPKARSLAQGFDKLPEDEQEKLLAVFRVMFEPQFAHLFTKGNDEDDA